MLNQFFTEVPFWLIIVCAVVSVFIGRMIRLWLDKRKIRQAEELKEKSRQIKKEMKRVRRKEKKQKNKQA